MEINKLLYILYLSQLHPAELNEGCIKLIGIIAMRLIANTCYRNLVSVVGIDI